MTGMVNMLRPIEYLKQIESHMKGLENENARLRKHLKLILDYEPNDVCKYDFAYDRLIDAYREAAKHGLSEEKNTILTCPACGFTYAMRPEAPADKESACTS